MRDTHTIPASWLEVELGDVVNYGATTKAEPDEIPDDAWLLELEDIEKDTSKLLTRVSFIERASKSTKNRFYAGDVLYGKLRPYLNKVIRADQDGYCTTEIVPLNGGTTIDGGYLFHWLRHPRFLEYVARTSHGLHMPRLGTESGRHAPFILAPIREQKRIALKVNALLARADVCGERLNRIPEILRRFREAVLGVAVSGKLTEEWRQQNPDLVDASFDVDAIRRRHAEAGGHRKGNAAPPTNDVHDLDASMFPVGWGLVDLRDLVDPARPITYGILKPGPEMEKGVSYVRVADFPNEQLNLKTVRKTTFKIDSAFSRSRLRTGDLLLSIRGTVGRLILIPSELDGANITQDSARLAIQDVVDSRYVLWFLRSGLAQNRMQRAVKGVAVRGINIGDVRALQVPLPSCHEQREITRRVEELFAMAQSLVRRYEATISQSEKLRPSILVKAFRGQLVDQDPADEPADMLLTRIAQEREAMKSDNKQAKRLQRSKVSRANMRTDVDPLRVASKLTDILRKRGRITPERLLLESGFEIDEFYNQLKVDVAAGRIREVRKGKGNEYRWLEEVR